MRKLFALCVLLGAFCAAHGQITLAGHAVVPSTTDSLLGQSSVVIGDADCNLTSPSGCTVPSGTGPYRGTLLASSSVSLTADRNLIAPLSPGRAYYVKNSTSGGKQVCVKGTSGAAACVPNGQTAIALSDGTNYNLISGGGSTSSLGLVIADGVTYATIQAAYTAACAASPNLNVYVPASSTVTDFAYNSQNYLVSTCTSQITDDRAGVTFGARGNNLFQAQTPRKDYYTREALMKFGQIAMIKNGVSSATTGVPSVVQWVVANPGDSTNDFSTKYNLLTKSVGMGLAGMFQTPAHMGTQNNEFFYGLPQTAFLLTSTCSGTCATVANGTADPTTVNGSSLTLGSSSTTGTLTFNITAASVGTETRFRNMQQAGLWYICDGRASTLSVQTSADNGFTWNNETVTTQPSSCGATGGIVAVGVQGVGTGSGCSTLTLGATGGTGFSATAFPNSVGQIDRVTVNSQGSGYNPYTSTITITGGSCSVNPTWGSLLTSNESVVYLPITHDGITNVRASNSGDGVKVIGWGLYNPSQTGLVWIDEGFGGTSIDSLFAPPSSYIAPWYNGLPIADTIYTQYLDNTVEAGQTLGYWFQQLYNLYTNLHVAKAATFSNATTCQAADYGWDTACRAYTPDVTWISATLGGDSTTVGGRDGDWSVMQQIEKINRAPGGNGNALYVDNSFNGINGYDWLTRQAYGNTDPTTHMIPQGRMIQNKNMQQINLIPPDDILGNPTYNMVHASQGSDAAPGYGFVGSNGAGLSIDSTAKAVKAIGGLVAEGALQVQPGTYTTTTYIPVTGSTSATYMICGTQAPNLQPTACSTPVNVTNGPTTLSATNYIQLCLNRQIVATGYYTLIRTSGYSGPVVVYDTSLYTNAHNTPCMADIGQTGSAYTATNWQPSGFFRINSPATPVDRRQFGAVRTSDNAWDINFGEGLHLGGSGGLGLKVVDTSNSNNYCRLSVGANGWAGSIECGGTLGSNRFDSLQPIRIQTGATSNPNLDVAPTALLSGTTPTIRFAPTSATQTCPSGGCNVLFDTDPTYNGYTAIFRGRSVDKFAVHAVNGLQFFGSSNYITSVNGTGTNLLRSTGTLTSTHLALFDANNNATASAAVVDDGTNFSVSEAGGTTITGGTQASIGTGTVSVQMNTTNGFLNGNWAVTALGIATSGSNFNSNPFRLLGSYYNGSSGVNDNWSATAVLGTGTNPTSTLQFTHSGTPGTATVDLPTGSTVNNSAICTPGNGLCGGGGGGGTDYWWQQLVGCTIGTSTGDNCSGNVQLPGNMPDANFYVQCTTQILLGGVTVVSLGLGYGSYPTTSGSNIPINVVAALGAGGSSSWTPAVTCHARHN